MTDPLKKIPLPDFNIPAYVDSFIANHPTVLDKDTADFLRTAVAARVDSMLPELYNQPKDARKQAQDGTKLRDTTWYSTLAASASVDARNSSIYENSKFFNYVIGKKTTGDMQHHIRLRTVTPKKVEEYFKDSIPSITLETSARAKHNIIGRGMHLYFSGFIYVDHDQIVVLPVSGEWFSVLTRLNQSLNLEVDAMGYLNALNMIVTIEALRRASPERMFATEALRRASPERMFATSCINEYIQHDYADVDQQCKQDLPDMLQKTNKAQFDEKTKEWISLIEREVSPANPSAVSIAAKVCGKPNVIETLKYFKMYDADVRKLVNTEDTFNKEKRDHLVALLESKPATLTLKELMGVNYGLFERIIIDAGKILNKSQGTKRASTSGATQHKKPRGQRPR